MSEAIRLLNAWSTTWFDTMLSVAWQSTLLIAAVALLLHACRNLPPAIRCWFWRIVAIKLLLMPFWVMHVPIASPVRVLSSAATVPAPSSADSPQIAPTASANQDAAGSPIVSPNETESSPPNETLSWHSLLALGWLVMVAIQLVRLAAQRFALSRLLRAAESAPPSLAEVAAGCSRELGLHRVPPVLVTQADISPFVCSATRPLLVLPASLVADALPMQMRPIILHELAHVRRRDLPWCLLLQLVRIMWWFHPLAHWVAYRESLERELACDQLAMSHAGVTPADYARTLVDAASRLAFPSVLRTAAAASLDGRHPLVVSSENQPFHLVGRLEP